jgi:hypothetical protein
MTPKGIGYKGSKERKNPKMRKMGIMSQPQIIEELMKHTETGKFPESIRMPSMKKRK